MYLYKIIQLMFITISMCIGSAYAQARNSENNGQCYEVVDSYEKFNRAMFQLDLTLDHTILKPVSTLYKKTVPSWGRDRVRNFIGNLKSPLTLLNNVAQGDSKSAFRTFWRFTINSTFGIGGLLDFASGFGLTENSQTFGDTFASYGADYGSYLVLPIIGPSSIRDAAGKVYDIVLDPLNLVLNYPERTGVFVASTISNRADYLDLSNSLEESSLDYYAQVRSMYLQYRAKKNIACKNKQIDYNVDYNMYNEEIK